jgi:hypothetical protein
MAVLRRFTTWNGKEPTWWNALDDRSRTLINEAYDRAQSSGYSTWSDWWRYATDHKADIGLAVGGVASVGAVAVATGGTALVPMAWAAGTKALTAGVSSGWSSWTRSAAEGRIDKARANGVTTTTKTTVPRPPQPNVQNGATMDLYTINATYKTEILKESLTVFENGGLQRLYDAFMNVRGDFTYLRNQWFQVSSDLGDAVRNAAAEARITQAKAFGNVVAAAVSNVYLNFIPFNKACGTLSNVWEGIFRCEKRFDDVHREGALLEEFMTYVTLMVSETTSDSAQKMNRLWKIYFRTNRVLNSLGGIQDSEQAAKHLLEHLANVTKGADIQKVWGSLIARATHPGVWAWETITQYLNGIKTRDMPQLFGLGEFAHTVQLRTIQFTDPNRWLQWGREAYNFLKTSSRHAAVEYVKAPFAYDEAGTYISLAMGLAQDAVTNPQQFASAVDIGANAGWKVVEQFHSLANLNFQGWTPSLSIDWENILSGGQMAAELMAGLFVKWAVQRDTLKKLNDPSTPLFERVSLLKELAGGSAKDYVEAIENLVAAKQKVNSAGTHATVAEAMLRYILAERAFYMNPAGQMFEGAAQVLAEFRVQMTRFQALASERASDILTTNLHANGACRSPHCYRV